MSIFGKFNIFSRKGKAGGASREELMAVFRSKYSNFQTLLESNTELLKIIADIEQKLGGRTVFGQSYIEAQTMRTIFHSARMVHCLEQMAGRQLAGLQQALAAIHGRIRLESGENAAPAVAGRDFILPYSALSRDSSETAGGKNANVGEIMNILGLPVPRGFAITTAAFRHYIQCNDLTASIQRMKARADIIEADTILQVSREIQEHILAGSVPPDLADAIAQAHAELTRAVGGEQGSVNISMRSSAVGEDSILSFAGQYLTVLNVRPEKILEAYRRIIASLFTPHAIAYRLHMGITFQEAVMAVACQEMIAARASGVMYTRNPVDPLENRIMIKAVLGLGPYAVDGVVPPDTYIFDKEPRLQLRETTLSEKPARLIALPQGDVADEPVPEAQRRQACLPAQLAELLAVYGLRLEAHFGTPQDVEWALDTDGRLVILQARPLRVDALDAGAGKLPAKALPGRTVLLEGGDIGCTGVGCGPVYRVATEADLADFPDGAVLVSAASSPQLVLAMTKAKAILTDAGNVAGHMASLAREYMVPTLLNLGTATRLAPGTLVTVDAFNARVYLGQVPELAEGGPQLHGIMHKTPIFNALRRRAALIVPLNLRDPRSDGFTPAGCRTIHDIMRYIHEKSYEEIFQLGDLVTDQGNLSVKLKAPLPLDLYVIDLGGGLGVDATQVSEITPQHVLSVPFGALLQGMLRDDLRTREPRPVHLGGFLSVMSRQMLTPAHVAAERFGDRSYAIISDRYLNFSSRVGYHYSVLDCHCGRTLAKNYINFQFKGGAADEARRGRRARTIEKILIASGFMVRTVGDQVTARFPKNEADKVREALDMIGRLLIFTRQMDMLMQNDKLVDIMADSFLRGDYHFEQRAGGE